MAGELPLTRKPASREAADAIRAAVRQADVLNDSRLARVEDAAGLFELLSDARVHAPIYTLPRPLTEASVAAFIETHWAEREAGVGLLFVRTDQEGRVMGYTDIQVWPEWAAAELGGALHPSLHNKGAGTKGAAQSFGWLFDALHVDLICETASLENVATQKMLDGLGFRRMGQVTSTRPDGTTRDSLVWEMTRDDWISTTGPPVQETP